MSLKPLVFGRTGQVAQELARRLPGGTFLDRAAADLAEPAACAAAVAQAAADCVIIAAAWTAVDAAEDDEPAAHVVNAEAPGAIARAAAARGLPVLHLSTDYVFDGSGTRPWAEDDRPAPLSAYGRTKRAGERAVAAAGGTHALLRTSWVVSAHGRNFVKTMLRLGAERDTVRVVDDQIGGLTPAAEIAAALTAMAEALVAGRGRGGVYHFAGTPEVSWADVAEAVFAGAGLGCTVTRIPTTEYPTPAPRPLNSRLDCRALEAAFGIARPDWHAGLDAILKELGHA